MTTPQLSVGFCHAIHHGLEPLPDHLKNPIVQVIDLKKIAGGPTAQQGDRYRLVLSDGVHFIQAMMTTQLNGLVKAGQLTNKCLVKITDYICNAVHDRRIAILLNCEVLGPPLAGNIGNPVSVDTSKANEAPVAVQKPQVAAPRQQQAPQQPRQVAMKAQPQAHPAAPFDPSNVSLTEIRLLNPYLPKWTIRARVTNKSDMRSWTNAKGSGRLFSVDLLDESGEIRATMFNDAAEHFFPLLAVGEVYYISRGSLKFANKKFSNVNNEFELTLDLSSTVQKVQDPSAASFLPKMHFKFIPIADLQDRPKDDIVDVIGVMQDVRPVSAIQTKAGNQLAKREVEIIDETQRPITVTLWGERAEHFNGEAGSLLAVKAAKLGEYGGNKSLSALQSSVVEINPDVERSIQLRAWYDTQDPAALQALSSSLSARSESGAGSRNYPERTLSYVKNETTALAGKTDYISVRATVMSIKTDKGVMYYKSCPGADCMRKVVEDGQGGWRCERCNKSYDRYNMRYVLQLSIADHTDNQWVSAFNDAAKSILNVDANELAMRKDSGDMARYEAVIEAARYQTMSFKASISEDLYEDQRRVRLKLLTATPINYAAEARNLVQKINQIMQPQ